MDGRGKNLRWLSERNIKFEIPYFQRPYVWDSVDWGNLIDSINDEKEKMMPFIGSIILKSDDNSNLDEGDDEDKTYLVIDGQQRLTTLSIMIKAFLDVYKNINTEFKSTILGFIYEIDDESDDNPIHTPRIKPSSSDSKEYNLVMADEIDLEAINECNGNIAEAYKYYLKLFQMYDESKLKTLSTKLRTTKYFFIAIVVGSYDDEQKIFDSVNSLGKKLTNADIIKNYLYQQLKAKMGNEESAKNEILKIYKSDWEDLFYSDTQKEFWNKKIIIGRIESTNMEVFFKDFGIVKGIYSPLDKENFKGIVKAYKEVIDSLDVKGLKKLSKEIYNYADSYYKMKYSYDECNNFIISDRFNVTMLLLEKLQTTTFNPYMLKIYKEKPANSDEQYFALQKYLLKRLVYGLSTKNYNKFCEQLIKGDNPIEMMENYIDFANVDYSVFPNGLSNIKNSPATLILFFIEMIKRNGEEDKHNDLVYSEKMSLEHIMPQSWKDNWLTVPCYKKKIMDDGTEKELEIKEVEEISKHRPTKICSIGNMTILPNKLNSSVSNSSFKVKIEGISTRKKGIKNYTTNMMVVKELVAFYDKNGKWDERDIYQREQELFDVLNDYYKFK